MYEYIKIPLAKYDELLKKEYIVNNLLETCKSNESNMIEEKDLNLINFMIICYKENYEKWIKNQRSDK